MNHTLRSVGLATLTLLWSAAAWSHSSSTSYLQLELSESGALHGRWDIPLRDIDAIIPLDADGDGQLRWGEVRMAEPAINAHALAALSVNSQAQHCSLHAATLAVSEHADGVYVSLDLSGHCLSALQPSVTIDYHLLFDLDRQHRGLIDLKLPQGTETGIFSPRQASLQFGSTTWLDVARAYFREGVWHVATGADHLLFLMALFLPSALCRRGGEWVAASTFAATFTQTARVITSFTLAHAATLTLAAVGWLHWPSRWVEAAVAATVCFAGLNNLYPIVHRRLTLVAAGFGLIHGSAIAGALLDLGLPVANRLPAIGFFNVGVEVSQLVLAAVLVPVGYALRHSTLYRTVILTPGSLIIAIIGLVWFAERIADFRVLPF